jgi:preprotein translocase subunit SecA
MSDPALFTRAASMDTRDGRIYNEDDLKTMSPLDLHYMRRMEHQPTPTQRATRQVGRNDVCPCGSGKKFKRCCLWRQKADRS